MSRNIVFLGIKHCGKSTHGKLLAERLSRRFLDTDDMLSEAYMKKFSCAAGDATPRAIMKKHGEDFFRRFEAEVIQEYLHGNQKNGDVLALGGGVPCNEYLTTEELKQLGVLLHLAIPADTAFKRIAAGGIPPFLQGEDPFGNFLKLYAWQAVIGKVGGKSLQPTHRAIGLRIRLCCRRNHTCSKPYDSSQNTPLQEMFRPVIHYRRFS